MNDPRTTGPPGPILAAPPPCEIAQSGLEALRLWIRHANPPADLVATVDALALTPTAALRRQADGWISLALPPVPVAELPLQPEAFSLAAARRDALHDLLFSLGLAEAMLVPLEPRNAGALLLARAAGPYGADEACRQLGATASLGRALAVLGRRRPHEPAPRRGLGEVAALFELNRNLARAGSAAAAADAVCDTVRVLLEPAAGAVVVVVAADEPPFAGGWPDGAPGDAAVRRASEAAGLGEPPVALLEHVARPLADVPLSWLTQGAASSPVGMAFGWAGAPPESAARVLASIQGSLSAAAARLAAQRRREEDRLRCVVDALPHGVALLAPDGRVRLLNPAARRLLDTLGAWPSANAPLHNIGSVDLRPLVLEARRVGAAEAELYSPGSGRTIEVTVVPAGAVTLSSSVAGLAAASPPGPETPFVPGLDTRGDVVVLLDDVTEARRQKAQLARSERLSALGVLISGIVHEINNPLATVLGYAQMLQSAPASEQRERWIRTLEEEARRCQRIVGNLLAFARPQESGRRLASLSAVAERALALVAYSYRAAGVEAVLQAHPQTPAVEANPDALLQTLINLLTNALHALEGFPGPRQVRVEIHPLSADCVSLCVADSGPGIPPENLERIFDPFFTTKAVGKGTGLGLSLVAATVRDHGGQVDVESTPGRGATFRITLPAGAKEPVDGAADEPEPEPRALLRPGLRNAQVLVVDDEPSVASLLAEILEQAGARAVVERNANRALERLVAEPPDAVIWDLSMTGLPGPVLLRELERRAPAMVPRLLFASGDLLQGVRGRPLRRPVLRKPFDLSAVLRTVAAVIAGEALEDGGDGALDGALDAGGRDGEGRLEGEDGGRDAATPGA